MSVWLDHLGCEGKSRRKPVFSFALAMRLWRKHIARRGTASPKARWHTPG